jgi:hypothetical protein
MTELILIARRHRRTVKLEQRGKGAAEHCINQKHCTDAP